MQSSWSSRWPNSAIIVTVILGLLVLILGGWATIEAGRISELGEQIAATRSDLEEAQDRIADLEDELAAAESSGSLFGDVLGGGEGDSLGLEDLLGALLGGDAEGLGGLEDLLNGLLGGESGDLEGLLGGLGASGDLGS